ncbi:MAG: class IV adenylate cyclase [Treponema sp.]|nr:class IV adenylate cyclase [Treponema sp.]
MYEIELKAHVDDRDTTIAKINSFATYCGAVQKSDTYYKLIADGKKISARIRQEKCVDGKSTADTSDPSSAQGNSHIFLTYKRKELRTDANGAAIEVNDEKECEISDAEPMEALLTDIGFAVSLKKEKSVMGWTYKDAHLELCAVPPLGDFLEIEILSPANDSATVEKYQQELQSLLAMAGIKKEKIEKRYYSDMLREARKETCSTANAE